MLKFHFTIYMLYTDLKYYSQRWLIYLLKLLVNISLWLLSFKAKYSYFILYQALRFILRIKWNGLLWRALQTTDYCAYLGVSIIIYNKGWGYQWRASLWPKLGTFLDQIKIIPSQQLQLAFILSITQVLPSSSSNLTHLTILKFCWYY